MVSVDPGSLPPFGTPELVSELLTDSNDDPALTRDQTEIFFDSTRSGNHDLWTARRASVDDPWGVPEPIAELNTGAAEEHPYVSGDGLRLYFSSGKPSDIFMSTRTDRASRWAPAIAVNEANSAVGEDMGGTSATELVLVVSSIQNLEDLFELQRDHQDSRWSVPLPLVEINTTGRDTGAHLDDLGLVMFFNRIEGGVSTIVWTSRATIDAPWAIPIPMPELVGSPSDPWLSPDLRTIYFTQGVDPDAQIYRATR